MILEGNERGYGAELARHLLNPRDNDHVTVHAIEGFVADDLLGAFAEAEAISGATQCTKYLFSLSLNPPPNEPVSIEDFEAAIAAAETKLNLIGQPRAIVFHEKNGRRHAHCVWSRIHARRMNAVNMPHYKRKLGDVSRELYRQHAWKMPPGFVDQAKRDLLNVSRQEAQQANREKRDRNELKAMFRRCWENSDSREAFAAALKEQGFVLARGKQRAFVAIDRDSKIWSLSRWCGVRPKDLRLRLGSEDNLPSIEDVLDEVTDLTPPSKPLPSPQQELRRSELVARQRKERAALLENQEERRVKARKAQQSRMPKGMRATFLRMTGRYQTFVKDAEAAAEATETRDRSEQQKLIETHLAERRALARELKRGHSGNPTRKRFAPDPRQTLETPPDQKLFSKAELLRNPALILDEVSKLNARFDRTDILRALTKYIDDPLVLSKAAETALKSPQLVRVEGTSGKSFATREMLNTEKQLQDTAQSMLENSGFHVYENHIKTAMKRQDASMHQAFGGKLSTEQRAAIRDVLGGSQIACIVGLAGAGKSTMLATAMDAWRRQGVTVHGAALAGKAADGLESASSIQSRTLASLEASWENEYEPISKGDVLVVDEAGMIGTRQLARVSSKLEKIGAKLVLVGDPDQLQPIEAGTPFRDLIDTCGASHLTEIHRQREDWQKQASRDLASGDTGKAVQLYEAHDAVNREEDQDAAIEALVESYALDITANSTETSRLAFAHRRKDVHALNQAIRAALRDGETPPPEVLLKTETGKRAFAQGDRIVFGGNDKELGVKNGMLGTVEAVSPDKVAVKLDGEETREMTFDPRSYRHFDHGYAVTIHKSQGATVDNAYVLASRSMDEHLSYVAMTRHRDQMRLYIKRDDQPTWAAPADQTRWAHTRNRDRPSIG
ncbi:AAA family ATPase [Roseibium album]|uniref:AAA family ATPase n=1 Tax=Roseibium album TaxID=311410 RepID=UPI00329954E2